MDPRIRKVKKETFFNNKKCCCSSYLILYNLSDMGLEQFDITWISLILKESRGTVKKVSGTDALCVGRISNQPLKKATIFSESTKRFIMEFTLPVRAEKIYNRITQCLIY